MDRKEKKIQEELKKLASQYQEEMIASARTIGDNIINKGAPPYQALAISKGKLEGIYAQAYQLYNAGNFKKAYRTFEMLSLLCDDDPRFLFGMAASLQGLKLFREAYGYFIVSATKDSDNPVPFYHAADCCLQEGDKISALVMVQLVIDKCKDRPEYSYIKDRSQVLKDSLTNELNAEGKTMYEQEASSTP
jgi:Tetratricopeptide repeat.